MPTRAMSANMFTLGLCFLLVTAQAVKFDSKLIKSVDCSKLPADYCTADLGCKKDSNGNCEVDPNLKPTINCTEQLYKSGQAVQAAEDSMEVLFKTIKTTCKNVGETTSKAIDTFASLEDEFESALDKYNSSLVEYTKEKAFMDDLQSQLDDLQVKCKATDPPPPPDCAIKIQKLQDQITKENATCSKLWIKVDMNKKMLDLASTQVSQGKAAMITATQGASKTFNSASTQVMDAVNKKDDAMTYWNAIVSSCSASSAVAQVKRKSYKRLSKMYDKIHRRMRSFKVE